MVHDCRSRLSQLGGALSLVGLVGLMGIQACGGGPDAVSIDQIPPDEKLVDLSSSEDQGVCQWAQGIASQKLPAGTNCAGNPITISGCLTVGPACPATVAQWRVCLPALLDRFAQDPCQILDLGFSGQMAFATFINQTSGCEGDTVALAIGPANGRPVATNSSTPLRVQAYNGAAWEDLCVSPSMHALGVISVGRDSLPVVAVSELPRKLEVTRLR